MNVHYYVIEQYPLQTVACFLTDEDAQDFVQEHEARLKAPAVVVRMAQSVQWVDGDITCAICEKETKESLTVTEGEGGMVFDEPVCQKCADWQFRLSQMDDDDIAYERARANGWED